MREYLATVSTILVLSATPALAFTGPISVFANAFLAAFIGYGTIIAITHLIVTILSRCRRCRSIRELNSGEQ